MRTIARHRLPPFSAKVIPCRVYEEVPPGTKLLCEPLNLRNKLVRPALLGSDSTVNLLVWNYTGYPVIVRENKILATTEDAYAPSWPAGSLVSRMTTQEDRQRQEQSCTQPGSAGPPKNANPTQQKLDSLASLKLGEILPTQESLEDLLAKSFNHLTPAKASAAREVIMRHQSAFAKNTDDLGTIAGAQHHINTGNHPPIKQGMRRIPAKYRAETDKEIQRMLKAGVIQPSRSDWASPPVLVRKKDGSVRFCVDYSKVNDVTKRDHYPLPRIEECLEFLSGKKWLSRLDCLAGYWMIDIAPADREKTAFQCPSGFFEFLKLPFGLCGAPADFARCLSAVISGLLFDVAFAYLDDVIVATETFEQHLSALEEILQRFEAKGIKLRPSKCLLLQHRLDVLGRIVSGTSLEVSPSNIEAIQKWPRPWNVKSLQRFLGFVNYNRQFVDHFAKTAEPLYALLQKKVNFKWTEAQEEAFQQLKKQLIEPPVLSLPTDDYPFVLDVDASESALGCQLNQVQEGTERIIAYSSKTLTRTQRKYCVTRNEMLAVLVFTRQFRHFLLGRPFVLRTDHAALVWLFRFKNAEGQLARFLEELAQYDMVIRHHKGVEHGNTDALSRLPLEPNHLVQDIGLEQLPCYPHCEYCPKPHEKWKEFLEEVDYVRPLSYVGNEQYERDVEEGASELSKIVFPPNAPADDYFFSQPPTVRTLDHAYAAPVPASALSTSGPDAAPAPSTSGPDAAPATAAPPDHDYATSSSSASTAEPAPNTSWGFDNRHVAEAQASDLGIGPVYLWKQENRDPTEVEFSRSSPAT